MKVVILGCGPAGLLAAHACGKRADVEIVSVKKRSPMAGAQFIHRSIPGIPVGSSKVSFIKFGTRAGYAQKVYGDPRHPCSWDNFPDGDYPCWSMKAIYDWLWERWESKIVDAKVTAHEVKTIEDDGWDLMISTIPKTVLCSNPNHEFATSSVKICSHKLNTAKNVVIYNGNGLIETFYRLSVLFDWVAYEYSPNAETPHNNYVDIQKPQSNNCDCCPNWMLAGRYGKWKRGVLVHHAYEEVHDAVQSL